MSTREAAVAGLFYPRDVGELRRQVLQLLHDAPARRGPAPKVLIVPHAGYVYSGATAAAAYRCLQGRAEHLRRVVLLGPAHRVYLRGMALPGDSHFTTPLGKVAVDTAALERIHQLAGVEVNDEAHLQEHCLEVQLPFLQCLLEDFRCLPILVGDCPASWVAEVLDTLWGGAETLLVISTDLSHYLDYDSARDCDQRTCARILAGASDLRGEEACGARAVNGLMRTRHRAGLTVHQLAACNSGDTAGDRARVVGYGAFVLH